MAHKILLVKKNTTEVNQIQWRDEQRFRERRLRAFSLPALLLLARIYSLALWFLPREQLQQTHILQPKMTVYGKLLSPKGWIKSTHALQYDMDESYKEQPRHGLMLPLPSEVDSSKCLECLDSTTTPHSKMIRQQSSFGQVQSL